MRFVPKGLTRLKMLYLKLQLFSILQQKVLQKHKSSIIYSFIFIHSMMSENDKKGTFNRSWLSHEMRYVGFFQKRRFRGSIFENLRMVILLGENFIFLKLSWDNQNFNNFQTFCVDSCCPSHKLSRTRTIWIMLPLNIRKIIKFYDPGDKSFGTDFSFVNLKNLAKPASFLKASMECIFSFS